MPSTSERFVLAVALSAAVAVCGYYCSLLVPHTGRRRPRSRVALLLADVQRISLRELLRSGHNKWVSLCGAVFDVSGDEFFDANCAGLYSSWVGHDVTFLLLHMGLTVEAADDTASVASYLDQDWPLEALRGDDKAVQRRLDLLKEWFVRFQSRYEVVAQLSDRYVGEDWDALRDELLPELGSSSGGKCPLGFGAKVISNVASRKSTDVEKLRTITFQGRCYDVVDSSLFSLEGRFAHFVGHDVTYALAVQSTRVEDLDVTPERAYTFEEQLKLEKYRNLFARELAVVGVKEHQDGNDSKKEVVNLHAVIEGSDDMPQELGIQHLQKALANANVEQMDEVCVRTTMTPLHKAVEKRRLDLVKLLVDAGADVGARAALYDDETPLEMARRFHFDDIVSHLESIAVSGN